MRYCGVGKIEKVSVAASTSVTWRERNRGGKVSLYRVRDGKGCGGRRWWWVTQRLVSLTHEKEAQQSLTCIYRVPSPEW